MNIAVLAATALLLVPVVVFCAECVLSLLTRRKKATKSDQIPRPRLAVLIPAHNEQAVLGATLQSVMGQIRPEDRVVVVADNCDDQTAAVAREYGAEVAERRDRERRGKGFALDFGVRHLEGDAPGIVIMVDADSHVHEGALEALARQVVETGRPAQAVYLLEQPPQPGPRDLVSALAFLVKNLVRPTGLARMGMPCLLTGTGMAFPWEAIRGARLATGNIVEDMQLGLDLALAGHAPQFCDAARVTGRLPELGDVAMTQRKRWEHGHLRTLITQVPRLLRGVFGRGGIGALALALEISVPPLSLLVMMLAAALGASVVAAKFGATWLAPAVLGGAGVLVGVCILSVWFKFGRKQIPLASLLAAPFYVLWKIPLYLAFLVKPQREWVRTERTDAEAAEAAATEALANLWPEDEPFPAFTQPSVVELCGVNLHAVDERDCIRRIMRDASTGRGGVVVTPNLDHVRRFRSDAEYAELVNKADLVVADGMPLVWASRLQGTPLPARVAGSDLIRSLSAAAAKAGRSVFLLGGDPGTAEATAERLKRQHPQIKIAGTCCPPMGFERDAEKMNGVMSAVVSARPDIVFVALGSPKQEQLMDRLRDRLPGTWWLGVGISFSFLSGEVRRAPRWMRSTGLEWLYRLLQEPGRLARRYLLHGIPFALRMLSGSMVRGVGRRLGWGRREPVLAGVGAFEVAEAEVAPAEARGETGQVISRPRNAANGKELVYKAFVSGMAAEFGVREVRMSGAGVNTGKQVCPCHPQGEGSTGGAPVLRGLRAVVLLGGSVRPNKLTGAIRRSVLDLPLEDGKSILWHWREEARKLRQMIGGVGVEHLPVHVMVDRLSPQPKCPPPCDDVTVLVERDLSPYRGTGGVLRDVAVEFGDEDVLLVANAAQALLMPLAEMAVSLAALDADVALLCHADGTPCGLMLVKCRALRKIAASGYVDMKEQALPQIARDHKVSHLYQTRASGLPVRNLDEYVNALQRRHRQNLAPPSDDPFAEETRPTFAIVEQGARIEKDARVLDSVVLKGAVVEAGALVVRSIVCPGGVLAVGETAIDSLVLNAEVAAR